MMDEKIQDRAKITIRATVQAPVEKIWEYWTEPEHIKKWNSASEDWHTTAAENDLRVGGAFLSRMEAKDGSFGFDFSGIYDEIKPNEVIAYTLGDGRKVRSTFLGKGIRTGITTVFEAETENSLELQQEGWQSILDHFKRYTEENYFDKLVPHLWYDKEAREAAEFYISLFDDSELLDARVIKDTPSGDAEAVSFLLAGQRFEAISGGPIFQFNPSVSLMVACYSKAEVNAKWEALSDGGTALMPLDEYDFNKWYGWVQDRFGLSWQLMLMSEDQVNQKITPCLLFSDEACGKAEEAMRFYAEIFQDSSIGFISRYENQEGITPKAKINYGAFTLSGMNLVAMDNGYDVDFSFNEAFSFIVYCKDQQEINYFWDKLSAVPEAEECGWIKDRFGLSWQILPLVFQEMLKEGNGEKYQRMVQALLKMKKLDIEALQKAYDGE